MMKIAVKFLVASLLFTGLVAETIRGGDQEERKLQDPAQSVDQTSGYGTRQRFSLPAYPDSLFSPADAEDVYVLELPKAKAGERVTCEFRCNQGGYGPRDGKSGGYSVNIFFRDVPPNSEDMEAIAKGQMRGDIGAGTSNTCDIDIGAVTNMDSEHAYFTIGYANFGFEDAYVSCTKHASCWGYVESARNWARTWWGA